eukprot:CAMPEP_0172484910 /NCGR_PEP_ID=MMETSP1066-20121228/12585_1 /TAXON_ID=671091 /ORGANISM="Coscinodiscus wailesii, Strain CCMP2513" /LENGTH=247 /DNA_ID=CAMNT_0013249739 /DNA_START=99 /DNA_END=839 /DNA_ORIENTATION=-
MTYSEDNNSCNDNGPLPATVTTLNRWHDRWEKNALGWHKACVHPALQEYLPRVLNSVLGKNKKHRVLVPLCGKTVDMAYLAKHEDVDQVVGIDGIQKAINEFSAENPELGIQTHSGDVQTLGKNECSTYKGSKITLIRADFFDVDSNIADGRFDLIWDRGSLVAIAPEIRSDYVSAIARLIKPGGYILLSTVDRREGTPEGVEAGPPFSLNEDAVKALYGNEPWIEYVEKIGEKDEIGDDDAERDHW